MIIQALLDLVYGVFNLLTTPIDIPELPSSVTYYLDTALGYMSAGCGYIACWLYSNYLFTLFKIVVAVEVGVMLYKFVMFILKKIPFFGIE